ncbi:hypothetical protein D5H78_11380 [Vallicoccus soli]|uniref:Uncharacterized protein n=1 Tax=Vallicoccus soli TaxID=2339232 RepID=A0A3A3Z199_9ACTN|nr:hypothetical protein D5H78_11380 [Vallicoccus soli]
MDLVGCPACGAPAERTPWTGPGPAGLASVLCAGGHWLLLPRARPRERPAARSGARPVAQPGAAGGRPTVGSPVSDSAVR